jgi:hypothetical protein
VLSVKDWPEPYVYGAHTVFLAGKSPSIRSYTVHIYGSGQLYDLIRLDHNDRQTPVGLMGLVLAPSSTLKNGSGQPYECAARGYKILGYLDMRI